MQTIQINTHIQYITNVLSQSEECNSKGHILKTNFHAHYNKEIFFFDDCNKNNLMVKHMTAVP